MLMDWQNSYCENGHISEKHLQIQNSSDMIHRTRENNPKIHTEAEKTLNSQSNLEKEKEKKEPRLEVSTIFNLKLCYRAIITKTSMVMAQQIHRLMEQNTGPRNKPMLLHPSES